MGTIWTAEDRLELLEHMNTINDWVLVRMTRRDEMDNGIVLIDHWRDRTDLFEIVDIGEKCKLFKPSHSQFWSLNDHGATVWCPEMPSDNQWLDEQYWWFREHDILPVIFEDDNILPLGDFLMFEIEQEREEHKGIIDIPEYHQLVSTWGVVTSVGGDVRDVSVSDRIMVEADTPVYRVQGKLIGVAQESDVICKVEKTVT